MARGQKGAAASSSAPTATRTGRRSAPRNGTSNTSSAARTIREATTYGKRSDAIEFLKKRVSDGLNGKIVLSTRGEQRVFRDRPRQRELSSDWRAHYDHV